MKRALFVIVVLSMLLKACGQGSSSTSKKTREDAEQTSMLPHLSINQEGTTIQARFNTPRDFYRMETDSMSFASYLRNLPLKTPNSEVKYYNGEVKPNYGVYAAVIDLPIGKRNLHQCADAIMRLRAAYLYEQKRYKDIQFNFTNGFRVDYSEWIKGKRISVQGNTVQWKQKTTAANNPDIFWQYLEIIFSYAGTSSLSKEMQEKPINELVIGDVFIQGGFPGHAVIIVDVAIHKTTKEKIFLLAQSYMPAQEIQLLHNPQNKNLSPWYKLSEIDEELKTPEWTFKSTDLKQFHE